MRSEVKVAAAKAWLVMMVRIGEQLDDADDVEPIHRELAVLVEELKADGTLADAVERLLKSDFLTREELENFDGAFHAACYAIAKSDGG